MKGKVSNQYYVVEGWASHSSGGYNYKRVFYASSGNEALKIALDEFKNIPEMLRVDSLRFASSYEILGLDKSVNS